MANTPITSMPVATSLDGTELVPIVQPPDASTGVSKRATTRQIANLASGFSGTGYVSCTCSGTSTAIVLTPITNGPQVTAYSNYQLFGFVASVSGDSGGWTASVVNSSGNPLSALSVYHASNSGPVAAGLNDMVAGNFYVYAYVSSLNGSAGGFFRASAGA